MLCVIPGEVGEIWLEAHKDIPIENRPVVLVKTPSIREARQYARDFDATLTIKDPDEHYNAQVDLLLRVAVDWRNYPLEFCRESLEDTFTPVALQKLIHQVLAGNIVTVEEKKS